MNNNSKQINAAAHSWQEKVKKHIENDRVFINSNWESYLATIRAGLTTHHSPLTTHHSPLTTHHSPLTTHHSPLTSI